MVEKKINELLNPDDEDWIKRILDKPRREADAKEAEEDNRAYYNNPLGSG